MLFWAVFLLIMVSIVALGVYLGLRLGVGTEKKSSCSRDAELTSTRRG